MVKSYAKIVSIVSVVASAIALYVMVMSILRVSAPDIMMNERTYTQFTDPKVYAQSLPFEKKEAEGNISQPTEAELSAGMQEGYTREINKLQRSGYRVLLDSGTAFVIAMGLFLFHFRMLKRLEQEGDGRG